MYAKHNQYKVVELEFEKNDPSEYPPVVDILQFDHKKLKLEDDMNKTYDEKLCCVYFKTVCANVIKGHHFKRNTYLQIMSIGFSDIAWRIFANLMSFTNDRNRKLNFFADPILIKINCNQRLSMNKMTYCDDLIIHFDRVCDID